MFMKLQPIPNFYANFVYFTYSRIAVLLATVLNNFSISFNRIHKKVLYQIGQEDSDSSITVF